MARNLKPIKLPRTPEDDRAGAPLDVAKAIAEFYQEFPHHKNDVFILNHQKFKSGVEAVADIAPTLDQYKDKVGFIKFGFTKIIAQGAFEAQMPCSASFDDSQKQQREATSYARIIIPAGPEFSPRMLKNMLGGGGFKKDLAEFPAMPEKFNDTEVWHRYVLDHEIGHAITMLGIDKSEARDLSTVQYRECEADTYAMLRYMKRSGGDTEFVEYVSGLRTISAVHAGAMHHLTSKALDRMLDMFEGGAFKLEDLTPQRCRELAIEIARKTAYTPEADYNFSEELKPIREMFMQAMKDSPKDESKRPTAVGVLGKILDVVDAGIKSPAVHETLVRYLEIIKTFAPEVASQPEVVNRMHKIMLDRKPQGGEPLLPPGTRALRDIFLDASMGVTPEKANDNKKRPDQKRKFGS